jgi:hypothetical protein
MVVRLFLAVAMLAAVTVGLLLPLPGRRDQPHLGFQLQAPFSARS